MSTEIRDAPVWRPKPVKPKPAPAIGSSSPPCPKCGSREAKTTDSRPTSIGTVHRKKRCHCGKTFSTQEVNIEWFERASAIESLIGDLRRGLVGLFAKGSSDA